MRLVLGIIISTVVIGLGVIIYMPNDPVDFMGIPVGGKKSDIDNFSENYQETGRSYIDGMGIRKYSFCESHNYSYRDYPNYTAFDSCENEIFLTFLESSDTIERAMVIRTFDIQQLEVNYQNILEKYGQPISDETNINEQELKSRFLTFGKQNSSIVKVIVAIYTHHEVPNLAQIRIQADTGKYIMYEHKVEEYYKKTFPMFYQDP